MNRCFKIIWSQTKGCTVVVSELAKRRGKSGLKAAVRVALAATLTGVTPAFAEEELVKAGTGENSYAVVADPAKTKGSNSLAIGNSAVTGDDNESEDEKTDGAIAIGMKNTKEMTQEYDTKASGKNAVAIGHRAKAIGNNSIAIGADAQAEYDGEDASPSAKRGPRPGAIAIGAESTAKSGGIAIGNAVAESSGVALGQVAFYAKSRASHGGFAAVAGTASRLGSTAIGYASQAINTNAVAIGNNAYASGYSAMALGNGNGFMPDYSAIDADESHPRKEEWEFQSTVAQGNYSWAAAGGQTGEEAVGGVAMGRNAKATGMGAVAIGVQNREESMGGHTVPLDPDPNEEPVDTDTFTEANGAYSMALGANAKTEGKYAVAVGRYSRANAKESLAMAGGTVNEKAAAGMAFGSKASVAVTGGVALGTDALADTEAGVVGYDPTGQVDSTTASATWKATLAALSIGDVSNKYTRQITNVAAGYNDTDAVNVAQLKKAIESITPKPNPGGSTTTDTRNTVQAGEHVNVVATPNSDGSSTYTVSVKADGEITSGNTGIVTGGAVYQETRVKQDGNYIKAANTAGENIIALDRQTKQNADDITSINNQVTNMGSSINKLGTRINRVGAGAAALAALHPQDFDPDDKWDFAAGYGNYKDSHAVAIGAFYRPTEDVLFSVGGSFDSGENLVNAGVTFKLGQHNNVGRSKVAMAKEILQLKQQNQSMQKELDDIKTYAAHRTSCDTL